MLRTAKINNWHKVFEFATGSIKILDLKRAQIAGGPTFKIMQIGLLVLILGLFEDWANDLLLQF